MVTDPSKQVKIGFVSGLVPREKSLAFELIMFYATKGNVSMKQVVVNDPVVDHVSGEKISTLNFLIAFCTIFCYTYLVLYVHVFILLSDYYWI